jgi:hypothetical protein
VEDNWESPVIFVVLVYNWNAIFIFKIFVLLKLSSTYQYVN